MQEFSSVTASSYDAEALAPLLTERAAAGWDVISIVAAGANIVAYLSRDSADADVSAVKIETEAAPTLPGDHAPVSDAAADADEPAGWGTAPDNDVAERANEDANAISGGVVAAGAAGVAAATGAQDDVGELAADAAAGAVSNVIAESADAAAEAATATDAATAAAAAASTVPAGWYADPSSRYELRYWDGNAWTEHVSRAGQQFTDPPVA